MAVLPKETESLQLKLLGGHKGRGGGVFSVCVQSTVCQWHNRCGKLCCFFLNHRTFSWLPANLIKSGFRVPVGVGGSLIYLRTNKSSCCPAHIFCKMDQPKKENAFNKLSKGANWCNSGSGVCDSSSGVRTDSFRSCIYVISNKNVKPKLKTLDPSIRLNEPSKSGIIISFLCFFIS